jgi:dUTP pyrophosphatase
MAQSKARVTMKVVVEQPTGVEFELGRSFAPMRVHPEDAGLDLLSTVTIMLKPGASAEIKTGVKCAIPANTMGLLCLRSSLARLGLTIAGGIIDEGFTGELVAIIRNASDKEVPIYRGNRIVQLIIIPIVKPVLQFVDELPNTARGTGAFGSTGK